MPVVFCLAAMLLLAPPRSPAAEVPIEPDKEIYARWRELIAPGAIVAAPRLEPTELLARHREAMGVPADFGRARDLEMLLDFRDEKFAVMIHYRANRQGAVRVDVSRDARHLITECAAGTSAWAHASGKTSPLSEKGAAAMRRGWFLPGKLFDLSTAPADAAIDFEGLSREGLPAVAVFRLRTADGYDARYFVSRETHRIVLRSSIEVPHPDIDATPIQTIEVTSDYRQIEGRWFSHRSEQFRLPAATPLQTTLVRSVRWGTLFADDTFAPPVENR